MPIVILIGKVMARAIGINRPGFWGSNFHGCGNSNVGGTSSQY